MVPLRGGNSAGLARSMTALIVGEEVSKNIVVNLVKRLYCGHNTNGLAFPAV
jgi:hypothetical protein